MEQDHPELASSHDSTTAGLPVSPSMGPALAVAQVPPHPTSIGGRTAWICAVCVVLAAAAALIAQLLIALINLCTNIAFYGRFSIEHSSPAHHNLGLFVIAIPIIGAIIIGFMARYGSKAIRGHGIPEAMEQVLVNRSRIPARVTFLKPLSAAISIGTGGPFGAEGPIIATGGALGSLIGQIIRTTAAERKTLLAAGAAAGMAATFGAPVSSILLAVELLVFEFAPRSMIPIALAAVTATGVRIAFEGAEPMFPMPDLAAPGGEALAIYVTLGAIVGLASIAVTKLVYAIEDGFEHLPVHWMWWPAIGAVAVGVVGYFRPETMGVGYDNITNIISNSKPLSFVALLALMKLISWSIALGSGTSGGTLAPLFTIGGGLGAVLGAGAAWLLPGAGVDIRIAALVGMTAIFAGASRALLASVVFAFETTLQPMGILPLLGGCTAAFLVSSLLMRQTIMTEKIARRGIRVPSEYGPDYLSQVLARDAMKSPVVTIRGDQTVAQVRAWIASGAAGRSHQGFPVLDAAGRLTGVLTRRDLLNPAEPDAKLAAELIRRPPIVVYADCTLREAADHMVNHDIGRLPVIDREDPSRVVGILTRSDLLAAHRKRLEETHTPERSLPLPFFGAARPSTSPKH